MWREIPSNKYKLTYQKISNPFIKNQSSIYLEFSNTVLKTKSVLKLFLKPLRNAQLIILLIKFWTQWLDQKEHTSTTVRVNGRIITDWGGQVFEKKTAGKGTHTLRLRWLQQKRTLNIIVPNTWFPKFWSGFIILIDFQIKWYYQSRYLTICGGDVSVL